MKIGSSSVLALCVGAQLVQKAYLGSTLVFSTQSEFLPSSLFGPADQGYWYDNQDLTTMYQDTAGTIPVTAVEQPVGRQLDKSGKGNHRIAPGPTTSRPILRSRYNMYLNSETFATQNVSVVAGQYRLRFEGTGTITLSGAATGTLSAGTHAITCTTGTLTSTVSGVVTRADLRTQGIPTSIPPYQRIITATDYDTVGFPLYLDTDGADDWMRTAATVDFSGSDKITLVQGLHKRNDTAAIFSELSVDANLNAGGYMVVTGNSVASLYSTKAGLGGAWARFNASQYPAPDTAIISVSHNLVSGQSRIWRNNVVGIDSIPGGVNFRNDHVYFYSRAGTGIRFNGRDYGQFAISRLLSDAERNQVESWLNSKMGGLY